MRTLRILSQSLFLLLFIVLFFQARYPYNSLLPADLFLRSSPLLAISTFLSSRSFISTMIPALVILLLTLALGRFFCGWICPLGTTIDMSDTVMHSLRSRFQHPNLTFMRSWKFMLLIVLLVTSVFSLQLVWLFDPISLLTRTFTIVIYPAFAFLIFGLFDVLFALGIFQEHVYALYSTAQTSILPMQQPVFAHGLAILLLFVCILLLGVLNRRFWCRNLCPLGALLGLFSKYRLLHRYVSSSCNDCAKCKTACRMNAVEDDFHQTRVTECIECGQCLSECPKQAIQFSFKPTPQSHKVDLSRRQLLGAGVTGVVALGLGKTLNPQSAPQNVIRAPGALEEQAFLDRCIRCMECVKICSSTGGCLQPSLWHAGVEGLWSPMVMPRMGYCEFSCTLCGQVCPTGAIRPLQETEKQTLKIGKAFFDKNRCIPWNSHQDCLVCEEHCPLPEKAIKFDIKPVLLANGDEKFVKFPYVDQELCIGCGICEYKCPVVGKAGIFITSTAT